MWKTFHERRQDWSMEEEDTSFQSPISQRIDREEEDPRGDYFPPYIRGRVIESEEGSEGEDTPIASRTRRRSVGGGIEESKEENTSSSEDGSDQSRSDELSDNSSSKEDEEEEEEEGRSEVVSEEDSSSSSSSNCSWENIDDSSEYSWSSVDSLGCKVEVKTYSKASEDSSSEEDSEDTSSSSSLSSSEDSFKMGEKDIPKFDGKRDKFEEWSVRWTSHGIRQKFDTVNKDVVHPEMPDRGICADRTTLTKRAKKLMKMNNSAMADIRTACAACSSLVVEINRSCTQHQVGDPHDIAQVNSFPNGRIWICLSNFYIKYRGDSLLDKIGLNKEMNTIVQHDGEHPDKQFDRAWTIYSRYSHKVVRPTYDDLIAQIVVGAYSPYNTCYIQKIIEDKANKDAAMKMVSLQELGNELFIAQAATSRGRQQDTSMYSQGTQQTQGQRETPRDTYTDEAVCYWCGGKGHKKFNCTKFKDGKPRTYNGTRTKNYEKNLKKKTGDKKTEKQPCGICKKKGHPDNMCFEKSENASKRPESWTSCLTEVERKELGLSSIYYRDVDAGVIINNNYEGAEYHCMSVGRPRTSAEVKLYELESEVLNGKAVPDNFDCLFDDNCFVFDTGATSTCSSSVRGAENLREQVGVSTITSSGENATQSQVGDIPVEKLDKNLEHCNYTVLRDVQFGPSNKFNLFAVNKMLDDGWCAEGNSKEGWCLKKDGYIIRFDIRISTVSSCVWCGYFKRSSVKKDVALVVADKEKKKVV